MIDIAHKVAAFAVALGVLIIVHELGHYVVARCGVKVLRFSVGFGRVVWSRRVGRDRHRVGDLGAAARRLRENARRARGRGRSGGPAARLQPAERVASARPSSPPGRSPTCCSRCCSSRRVCSRRARAARAARAAAGRHAGGQRRFRRGRRGARVDGAPVAFLAGPALAPAARLGQPERDARPCCSPTAACDARALARLAQGRRLGGRLPHPARPEDRPGAAAASSEVLPGKPAAAAGLRAGDTIVAVDGVAMLRRSMWRA